MTIFFILTLLLHILFSISLLKMVIILSLSLSLYIYIYIYRTSILIETKSHREENRFMNGIKYAVFKDRNIRLLGKNQYTSMSKRDQLGDK